MKKYLWTILAIGTAMLLSSCTGRPSGLAVINMSDATANPATQAAIVAQNTTPEFVVAWILWGTPTPTPYREPRSAVNTPSAATTEIAAVPTATLPATATLPVTATLPSTATTAAAAAATGGHGTKGRAAAGMQVFTGIGGCSSCHDTSMGHTVVGPTLKGISKTAATRKPGMAAEDYIYESITSPNAFVVKGFSSGIMPQTFKSTLSAQQIEDVIAYLMSLK